MIVFKPAGSRRYMLWALVCLKHNHGIRTFLLNYFVTITKRNVIAGFTTEVLADNKLMAAVLHKSGCKIRSQLEDRVYSFELDFA